MQRQAGFSLQALLPAWLCGAFVTYFLLGFLEYFYPRPFQIFIVGLLPAILTTGFFYFLFKSTLREPLIDWRALAFRCLTWMAGLAFAAAVVNLCLQFPDRSDPDLFRLEGSNLWVFTGLLVVSFVCAFFLLRSMHRRGVGQRVEESRLLAFFKDNFPGLSLSTLFLVAYFSLAVTLGILPDDNFYDTDSASWFNRFSAPAGQLIEMRPVHPFAFLIFRPLVWIISALLAGNKLYAVLLLNAGAGALCVFLAWVFVKGWSQNRTFALLVAAVLGSTSSHLILSASLETYIFSAAALISFLILSQRENPSLKALVPAGLLTFGITLTNFIQTLIVFVFMDFKIIKIAKYIAIVTAAALVLAFLQVKIYPTSQPFYLPSNLLSENRYSYSILEASLPRTLDRAQALGRTISLFSVVAPRPLILLEETGCEFPCFQTYRHRWNGAQINSYSGFGSFLARTWFLMLMLAGGLFTWRLIKSPKSVMLQAALLACILFNFVLHMNYGDDPMLYSGDWTYAVVFFTAFAFKDLAEKIWFQAAGLVFLIMLMINNLRFLQAVLNALSPYWSG